MRIVVKILARIFTRIFHTEFFGCPKPPARKRQNFTEKIPSKILHALGAFWKGPRPESARTGGWGEAAMEEVVIPVDLNQKS